MKVQTLLPLELMLNIHQQQRLCYMRYCTSGLAARITYLENIPEDSKEYAARASLKQLDSLRKEIFNKPY